MRKLLAYLFIINLFPVYSQVNSYNNSDSILIKLGFSPKYFTILTYQEARNKYYNSKPYDFSLRPNDSIILVKVDTIFEKVILNNTTIPYKLDLSSRVFKDLVDFNSCKFKDKVYLFNSQFYKSFVISNAIFDSIISIHNCKFFKSALLNNARFHFFVIDNCDFQDDVTFNESKFTKETYIDGSLFNKICSFTHTYFIEQASFMGSSFTIRPFFWEANFLDSTFFSSVILKDGIDFQSTRFKYLLSLRSLDSKGKIYFDNASLPEYIDLTNIKTDFPLDFNFINDSLKDYKYKINIYKTDLNKLIITDRFSLWFEENLNTDQRNVIYKQLLIYLDNQGYKQVYKTIDIEYRGFENKYYNGFLKRIGSNLNKIWWNYGYDKDRIFIISLLMIILFSLVVFIKLDFFINKVYVIGSLSKRLKSNLLIKNKIRKSLFDYFVALLFTVFLFFNLKLSIDKISFDRFISGLFVLFVFTLGLVCTAFIINLIVTI